jgi:hypothetical protein
VNSDLCLSHGEYIFFVKQSQDLQKWRRGHIFQKVLLFRIHIHFCTCMLVISYLRRIFLYVICKYRIIIIIICACTWFYCLIILSIPIEPLSLYIYIYIEYHATPIADTTPVTHQA